MRLLRSSFVLGVVLALSFGCAVKTPPGLTPADQATYSATVTADNVSHAVSTVRDFAVRMNEEGRLSTTITADVVRFDKVSQATLAAAPSGWQVSVGAGWRALKAELPTSLLLNVTVSSSITTLDALLAVLGVS